ncbi:hypothetical protein FD723_30690 [Nostoc sp. C052]|uniref:hypothetical protein n=1 Tax=Nostoc sp. C052 TaxID=2576902 RepID=UPI0015C37633|nr:hypothetical protein [Nostoc sp. C052]QLE44363.1 hypothetical protein FD723_30690 [Nostoc sp. C052]
MFDLHQTIKDRHSTWKFLSQPVPRALLDEALAVGVCSRRSPRSSARGFAKPCHDRELGTIGPKMRTEQTPTKLNTEQLERKAPTGHSTARCDVKRIAGTTL